MGEHTRAGTEWREWGVGTPKTHHLQLYGGSLDEVIVAVELVTNISTELEVMYDVVLE